MKRLKKILLVGDDEITCYLTKSLLNAMEAAEEIDCVHNGIEGMEYLYECSEKEDYPEVIFLDINMPGMDGFQLIEVLNDQKEIDIKKLNIIMLTTSVSTRDVKRAASFGNKVKGYITKPLDPLMVKEVLHCLKEE